MCDTLLLLKAKEIAEITTRLHSLDDEMRTLNLQLGEKLITYNKLLGRDE